MALTRRGLLLAVGDAHVYEPPEAAKDEGVGCGACEFFCPARPSTAMQVEGR